MTSFWDFQMCVGSVKTRNAQKAQFTVNLNPRTHYILKEGLSMDARIHMSVKAPGTSRDNPFRKKHTMNCVQHVKTLFSLPPIAQTLGKLRQTQLFTLNKHCVRGKCQHFKRWIQLLSLHCQTHKCSSEQLWHHRTCCSGTMAESQLKGF